MAGNIEILIGQGGEEDAVLKLRLLDTPGFAYSLAAVEQQESGLETGLYLAAVPDIFVAGNYTGHLYTADDELLASGYLSHLRSEALAVFRFDEVALLFNTVLEPTAAFAWPISIPEIMAWIGAVSKGKVTENRLTGEQTLRNDADDADIAVADVEDDGTVFTRGKFE